MSVVNGQFTRTNSFGAGVERSYPRFFIEAVEDELASSQSGRRIFRDEERVEIIMPGNPYTRPVQRVTAAHRQQWPKEYEAFKAGQELAPEGTPLEEWPRLKRGQVLELKALGFKTIEQVAHMGDQAIQQVGMGGRQLCELARAFLDDAARSAEVERLAGANAAKDNEIADLKLRLAALEQTARMVEAQLDAARHQGASSVTTALPPEGAAPAAPTAGVASALAVLAQPRGRGRPRKEDSPAPPPPPASADDGER
jgi:hypothetical protein